MFVTMISEAISTRSTSREEGASKVWQRGCDGKCCSRMIDDSTLSILDRDVFEYMMILYLQ